MQPPQHQSRDHLVAGLDQCECVAEWIVQFQPAANVGETDRRTVTLARLQSAGIADLDEEVCIPTLYGDADREAAGRRAQSVLHGVLDQRL